MLLVDALRTTAARLRAGERYRWTHQGACNCGHLAQTLTRKSRQEIHQAALQKAGDWREHVVEYCPSSGYPIDHILEEMLAAGLTLDDIRHLERLSDPRVLRRLPAEARALDFRERQHVVRYMEAWADLLEEQAPALSTTEAPTVEPSTVEPATFEPATLEPATFERGPTETEPASREAA